MKLVHVYTDGKGPEKIPGGCGYYRFIQPAKFTETPVRKDFYSSFYSTAEDQVTALWENFDVCHMGRIEQPLLLSGLVCSRYINEQAGIPKKIIVDMDDDFLNIHDDNDAKRVYVEGNEKFMTVKALLREADGLTVSTEKLAELYSQYNTNIEVFENLMDTDIWNFENTKKDDGKIRIGWSGGMSHHMDLVEFTPVIEAILNKYDNVIFSILGYQPVEWAKFGEQIERGLPVPNHKFPEALALQGYDIGVAPLADTEFNQAKSAIKYYEYSMLKVPSVCQKGDHLPYERKGNSESMLVAGNTNEWVEALSKLVENEALRKSIGVGAYNHVTRYFPADRDSNRRTSFYERTFSGELKNTKRSKEYRAA
jgi:glycosyltransferase involved in cell wall biosynthesis